MAPWNKRKNKSESAAPTPVAPRKDGLRSLFANSVMSNAMDEVAGNKPFLLDAGHGVLLALDVASIGGLSDKSKGDAEKGQFVSNLRSNSPMIDIVMDDDLAEADQLVFIPTSEGLGFDGISSFSFISQNKDVVFHWAIADVAAEEVLVTAQVATLDQARAIAAGEADVADLVRLEDGDDIVTAPAAGTEAGAREETAREESAIDTSLHAPVVVDEQSDEPAIGGASAYTPDGDEPPFSSGDGIGGVGGDPEDIENSFGEEPDVDADSFGEDDERDDLDEDTDMDLDAEGDGPQIDFAATDDEPVDEPGDAASDLELDPDEVDEHEDTSATDYDPEASEPTFDDPEVASRAQVQETVARRLHGNQLDIRVDLAPFEQFFAHTGAEGKLFSFNDDGGWLSKNVNEMARAANSEMQMAIDAARENERQLFIQMMSKYAHQLQDKLDVQNPETFYGHAMEVIERNNTPSVGEREQMVEARRRELREDYDKRRETFVQQVVARESLVYDQRNQPRLDGDLAKVAHDFDGMMSDRLHAEIDTLNERRQAHAETELEKCETQTLEVLAGVHKEHLADIDKMRAAHVARMEEFVKEHREHEIAQAKVLQDEIDQAGKITSLTQDFEGRMAAVRAEYESRLRAQDERIEVLRADHQEQLRRVAAEHDERVAHVQAAAAEAQVELDRKAAEAEKRVQEADERVQEVEQEKTELRTKYKSAMEEAKTDHQLSASRESNLRETIDNLTKSVNSLQGSADNRVAEVERRASEAEARADRRSKYMLGGLVLAALATGGAGWAIGHDGGDKAPAPAPTVTATATTTATATATATSTQTVTAVPTASQTMPQPTKTVTVTAQPRR